ncbi:MAG: DUF4363 family protein [Clostridia bacterium]|jgi:hypothetical protein|nr:DUF4363 family protein [Clostridia bacterium]
MTKWILIRWSGVLLLLAVLVGGIFYESNLVKTSLNGAKEYCYQIEIAAQNNGGIVNGEVASLVDNMQSYWDKKESQLCFFTNYKSIEQLGIEIVRLKTYIDEEEEIEFFTSLEIIKHYTENFEYFVGSNIHNIL